MVICADDLREGDLLLVNDEQDLVEITYVHVCQETQLVFMTTRCMWSDRFILPPPFRIENYVEIWG